METRDVSSWTEGENLWYNYVAALVTGTSQAVFVVLKKEPCHRE